MDCRSFLIERGDLSGIHLGVTEVSTSMVICEVKDEIESHPRIIEQLQKKHWIFRSLLGKMVSVNAGSGSFSFLDINREQELSLSDLTILSSKSFE